MQWPLDPDSDPAFQVNMDPDAGFDDQKLKRKTAEKMIFC
jgi:hypothetical protein